MMRGIKSLALVLALTFIGFSFGCTGENSGKAGVSPTEQVQWKPDGIISPGEYWMNFSSRDGTFSAFFRVENGTLFVGMKARTHGWLAMGFGGSVGMKNIDIVIAYVLLNGVAKISASYSTGFAGLHVSDTTLGGSFDVISYGGMEDENWTVVEFSRKLDTGDRYDFVVTPEKPFRVIWAYGLVDDFLSMHVSAASTFINPEVVE